MPNEKVFTFTPTSDPNRLIAIDARWDVLTSRDIPETGAKALYCLLLDLSLNPEHNSGVRGRVMCSITWLSQTIGKSRKAVCNWLQQLVSSGRIWIKPIPRPTTRPMNCYFISAFHPRREANHMPNDGLWAGKKKQPEWKSKILNHKRGRHERPLCSESPTLDIENVPRGTKSNGASPSQVADTDNSMVTRSARSSEPGVHGQVNQGSTVSALPVHRASELGEHGQVNQGSTARALPVHLHGELGAHCTCSPSSHNTESPVGDGGSKEGGKGPTPPNGGMEKFRASLAGMFPSRLLDLERRLVGRMQRAENDLARAEFRARLKIVREQIEGGPVPEGAINPESAKKPSKQSHDHELSPEEMLESARAAREFGVTLTEAQKAALDSVGERQKP